MTVLVWLLLWLFSHCPVGHGWELGLVAAVALEAVLAFHRWAVNDDAGDTYEYVFTLGEEDES